MDSTAHGARGGNPEDRERALVSEMRYRHLSGDPPDAPPPPDNEFPELYAMAMEDRFENGIVQTILAIKDGSIRLYSSSGTSVVVAGGLELHESACEFVRKGAAKLPQAADADDFEPPPVGRIAFYFLTYRGTMRITLPTFAVIDEESEFASLYRCAFLLMRDVIDLSPMTESGIQRAIFSPSPDSMAGKYGRVFILSHECDREAAAQVAAVCLRNRFLPLGSQEVPSSFSRESSIKESIRASDFVIAIITADKPSAAGWFHYEWGLADGLGKWVVVLDQRIAKEPAEISIHATVDSIPELEELLEKYRIHQSLSS